jgi:membrane-associated HD superfamily phosphohydrolase
MPVPKELEKIFESHSLPDDIRYEVMRRLSESQNQSEYEDDQNVLKNYKGNFRKMFDLILQIAPSLTFFSRVSICGNKSLKRINVNPSVKQVTNRLTSRASTPKTNKSKTNCIDCSSLKLRKNVMKS